MLSKKNKNGGVCPWCPPCFSMMLRDLDKLPRAFVYADDLIESLLESIYDDGPRSGNGGDSVFFTYQRGETQYMVARYGTLELDENVRSCEAVCPHNPNVGEVLCVEDLSEDSRTKFSALVTEAPSLKAYVGLRLTDSLSLIWISQTPAKRKEAAAWAKTLSRFGPVAKRLVSTDVVSGGADEGDDTLTVVVDRQNRVVRASRAALTFFGGSEAHEEFNKRQRDDVDNVLERGPGLKRDTLNRSDMSESNRTFLDARRFSSSPLSASSSSVSSTSSSSLRGQNDEEEDDEEGKEEIKGKRLRKSEKLPKDIIGASVYSLFAEESRDTITELLEGSTSTAANVRLAKSHKFVADCQTERMRRVIRFHFFDRSLQHKLDLEKSALHLQRKVVRQLAHELRNKYTASIEVMESMIDLVERLEPDTDSKKVDHTLLKEQLPDVKAALTLLREGNQLIETRLAVSKMQRGVYRSQPNVRRLKLGDYLESVVDKFQKQLQPGVSLAVADLPETQRLKDTKVLMDFFVLEHCFTQIMNNCVKFTDQGSINIYVYEKDKGKDSYAIVFGVKDTGPGISEEIRASFFDHDVLDGSARGTGLGISSCHLFLQAIDGQIWIKSSSDSSSSSSDSANHENNKKGTHADIRFQIPCRPYSSKTREKQQRKKEHREPYGGGDDGKDERPDDDQILQSSSSFSRDPLRSTVSWSTANSALNDDKSLRLRVASKEEDDDGDDEDKRINPSSSLTTETISLPGELSAATLSAKDTKEMSPLSPTVPTSSSEEDDDDPRRLSKSPAFLETVAELVVVEDSDLMRKLIRKKLTSALEPRATKAIVHEFDTVEKAIAYFESRAENPMTSYSIVSIDHNLQSKGGRLTGSDLITYLTDHAFPGTMISVSGDDAVSQEHKNLGANVVLGKPLPPLPEIRTRLNIPPPRTSHGDHLASS